MLIINGKWICVSIKVFFLKVLVTWNTVRETSHSDIWAFSEFRSLTENAMLADDLWDKENVVLYMEPEKKVMVFNKPI